MPRLSANNIDIEYEAFGSDADPVILLIMGQAAQMTVWPESFCRGLAQRGFRVIRFDNRDVGLSTHFNGVKAPGVARALFAALFGIPIRTPYTLHDMADDAAGLLEELGIDSAHIVGASMGGMIAQILAATKAGRTRSLVSMMSTSGKRGLKPPKLALMRHVVFGQKKNMRHEQVIAFYLRFAKLVESPAYPTPADERERLVRSWVDRSFDMPASFRQFAAMAGCGDRTPLLESIRRPSLVIHGEDDPLICVDGGRHTASCIPDARLEVIPGMGHDMPASLVPNLVDIIASHCAAVEDNYATAARAVATNA